jgi:protein arginine N-methyltransferase 3
VSAVVLWFDVEFSARFCPERPVVLSTAPAERSTHWAQAVLPLSRPVDLAPGGALSCRLSMARSRAQHRALEISLEYGPAALGPGAAALATVDAYRMEVRG